MKIVFFDGECLLCQGFVQFLWKRDKVHRLHFASLNGLKARELLSQEITMEKESVVYYDEGKIYFRTDALIGILKNLGWEMRILAFGLSLLPCAFRDYFYKRIARHRYQWFGRSEECLLLQGHEKEYFLD